LIQFGDAFGVVALALVVATALLMLMRRRLLRRTRNLALLRRVHICLATAAGVFLVLHVAFFVDYPVTPAIAMGYGSAAMAVFVWLTGTAFLERLRDSLFFHGTMSFSTLGLMAVHSAGAGVNVPTFAAVGVLVLVGGASFYALSEHLAKAIDPKQGGTRR